MTDFFMTERIYPAGRIARCVVWLLDRLPERVLLEVIDSYWTSRDIARIDERAGEFDELFAPKDEQ